MSIHRFSGKLPRETSERYRPFDITIHAADEYIDIGIMGGSDELKEAMMQCKDMVKRKDQQTRMDPASSKFTSSHRTNFGRISKTP